MMDEATVLQFQDKLVDEPDSVFMNRNSNKQKS